MINKNGGMALLTVLIVLLLVSLSVTALLSSSLLSSKMAYYGQQQLEASQQVFALHQQNLAVWMLLPEPAESTFSSGSGSGFSLSVVSNISSVIDCPEQYGLIAQGISCALLLLSTSVRHTTELQPVRYHSLILLSYPAESADCTACTRAILLSTYADESGGF